MSKKVCTKCGYYGEGQYPGSLAVEIILWLALAIAGILYSWWRRVLNENNICPKCSCKSMVSVKSNEGKETIEKFNIEIKPAVDILANSKKN